MFSSLITNRQFLRLCAGQFLALAAGYAVHFVSAIHIEDLTHASGPMSGLVLSIVAPGLLAGLWAGTLVDRYHRGNLLVLSLVLRGLAVMIFFLPISMDNWLPVIYLVNFLLAIFVQFEITIEASLLPDLVDETQLLAANSVFGVNTLAAQGIGFLIVGPTLLRIDGLSATGGVASLGFLIALLLVATLFRRPKNAKHHWFDCTKPSTIAGHQVKPATAKDMLSSLWAGWKFISIDHPARKAVIHLTAVYTFLMVVVTLLPGFLSRIVGQSADDFSILALPTGVGFGIGILIINRYGNRFGTGNLGDIGLSLAGLAMGSIALWQGEGGVLTAALALPFAGVGLAFVIISARTVLQSRPPATLRGRVWAAQVVLSNAVALIPILMSGNLADWIGIERVLLLTSLIVLFIGLGNIPARLKNNFLKEARE